ncbi:MAG: beta strand repeat-containing protein, partial [Isosphaeraceae bacterium]
MAATPVLTRILSRSDRKNRISSRRRRRVELIPDFEPLEIKLAPSVMTWTGGGTTTNWSDASNWGGTAPVAGDDLVFPSVTNETANNDFTAGTSFNSITISGSGYSLTGNAIALTGGITASFSSGSSTDNIATALGNGSVSVSAGGELIQGGAVSGSAGLALTGGGTLFLTSSSSYTGTTTVTTGSTLNLGGAIATDVTVDSTSTLEGSGIVGGNITASGYVDLSMGAALTAHNSTFNTGSTLSDSLHGTTPGTDYGQLVNSVGGLTLDNPTLNVTLGTGYVPAVGSQYVIIQNAGTTAVTGTFNNQPEGSHLNIGGYPFSITYAGSYNGTTNNVILTALTPTTSVLTSSPSPSTYGQAVTLTDTVTSTSGTPTGSVEFWDGTTDLGPGTLNASGVATLTTSSLPAGSDSLTAVYSGDSTFGGSTGSTTQTVNQKALTVSGITAANKVYDGTTNATLDTTSAALVGVIGTDTVTLDSTAAAGSFASANVGTGITVNISGLTISGAQAGNYILTQPTTTADITPATLTVSGITAANKVYDGTTNATLDTTSAALVGVIGTDTVTLDSTAAAGSFASANVGTGITVNISGLTISGAQAGNYILTQPTTTADISAKTVTPQITADNKTYDGLTAATLTSQTVNGTIGADVVTLVVTAANFDTKDAGTGKTVTATGLSLGGADAGNYTL